VRQQFFILLVTLARQPVDMRFDIADELAAQSGPFLFIAECGQALVAGQRNLRIDDHRAVLRQLDHDVGLLQPAAVVPQPHPPALRDVVAALAEPRRFEDAFKRNLTPSAENLRIAPEGFGKTIGLTADRIAGFEHYLDLFLERQHLAGFRVVGRFDLLLQVLDALAQRIQDRA